MMRARSVFILGLLDLRLTMRDRPALFWMVFFPVALMWFFGAVFGGGSREPPRVSLAVVNEDQGFLGAAFLEAMRGEGVDLQECTRAAADTARDLPRILTIPASFTENVMAGQKVALQLVKSEDASARFDQAAEVRVWRSIIRVLANLIEVNREMGDRAGGAPDRAEAERRYREIAARPALVATRAQDAGTGRAVPMGFTQSVPGILTMSILMMTVIYGAVFLTMEKSEGSLRRQGTLPLSRVNILTGKILGRLFLALTQALVLLLVGRVFFHVFWGRSPVGLALTVLAFAACCASLGLLFGALLRTPEQAGSMGWIAPLILAGMGGCWWPLEIVPRWLQIVGHASPAAWAMDAFHRLISFGGGVQSVLLPVLVLVGFSIAATLIGARYLKWE